MYICVVLSQARSETSLRHEDASRSLRLKSDDRGLGLGPSGYYYMSVLASLYVCVPDMQNEDIEISTC